MERYTWLLDAPFKIGANCCDCNKKKPAKRYEKESGRKPLIATMATESRLRKTRWYKFGCNAFEQIRPISAPMSFWTESDVLEYIKAHEIEIAEIYGDIVHDGKNWTTTGANRTGCIWCLFGITQDPERFIRLKENEPKRYEYVIGGGEFEDGMWVPNKAGLGYRFVIDWLNEHGNMKIKY